MQNVAFLANRAEREAGQLLSKMEKAKGGQPYQSDSRGPGFSGLGVPPAVPSPPARRIRWSRLAQVGDVEPAGLELAGGPASRAAVKLGSAPIRTKPLVGPAAAGSGREWLFAPDAGGVRLGWLLVSVPLLGCRASLSRARQRAEEVRILARRPLLLQNVAFLANRAEREAGQLLSKMEKAKGGHAECCVSSQSGRARGGAVALQDGEGKRRACRMLRF